MIKTRLLLGLLFLSLILGITACSHASQPTQPAQLQPVLRQPGPLVLTDEQGRYPLGYHLELLEDRQGELTIEQVSSPKYADRFAPSQVETPNFGYTGSVYWVRFEVSNQARAETHWLLELGFANMHYVDLYVPRPDGVGFAVRQTGSLRPFTSRDLPDRHIIFSLSLPPQAEETIYLRFQSGASMTLPLTLWSWEAFTNVALPEHLGWGLFYGALIIILGYNLFLLLSLRESSYLYYVLFLALLLLTAAAYDGSGGQYLWPRWISLNRYAVLLFLGLLMAAMLKFTDSFLLQEVRTRGLPPLFTGLLAVWGVLILLVPFVDYGILVTPIVLWSLVTVAAIMLTGVIAATRGYRPARLFLLSWLGFIIGLTMLFLVRLRLLPSTPITEEFWRFGMIWLGLFWALALADRINLLKAETEAANLALDRSERRLSQFLEALPVGVTVYGADRKVHYINQRTRQILANPARGIQPDPAAGRTLDEAINYFSLHIEGTEQSYPVEQLPFSQALRGEFSHVNDLEAGLVDRRVPLEIWASPVFDEDGAVKYAIAAFDDITQRKRAEQALRESQARLSGILDVTAEAIISIDETQHIILFNRAAESIFGYASEEVIGQSLDILLPEQFIAAHREHVKAFGRSKTATRTMTERQAIYGLRKNGEQFSAAGSISKLEIRGAMVFTILMRDITQHLEVEAELQRHRQNLEELVEARTEQLTRTNDQLQSEISRRLEQARLLAAAAERNRLARDLHDAVTQILFSANLVAEVLPQIWQRDPQQGQESLKELRRLIRGALAEMRTLLLELRPEALTKTPLGELIAQLTEAVTSRVYLPFKLYIENVPLLPGEVHTTFYHIAQEALNNAVKHAGASQVSVSLNVSPIPDANSEDGWHGLVKLVVRDDGVGFQTGSLGKEKMGIGIMRERASAIGADLSLESWSGEGTQVILTWKR